MVTTIKVKDAEREFPNHSDYPNIHISGSLTGMKKLYGWDNKYVFRIGSYYYNLKGHPNVGRWV